MDKSVTKGCEDPTELGDVAVALKARLVIQGVEHGLESISPTFYEQLLRQYPHDKKFLSQRENFSTEKALKILFYQKAVNKMLLELTPGVNFINILLTAFGTHRSQKRKKRL